MQYIFINSIANCNYLLYIKVNITNCNITGGDTVKIKIKDRNTFNELIIKKGFSKNRLAKEADLAQPTVVQISNGKRNPSPISANKILQVLQVDFDDVFKIEK